MEWFDILVRCLVIFVVYKLITWLYNERKIRRKVENYRVRTRMACGYGSREREIHKDLYKSMKTPPEIQNIRNLAKEFEITHDPNVIITMGDVYLRGGYPRFLPDPEMAGELFWVVTLWYDGHVGNLARSKYAEARSYTIPVEDRAGEILDTSYGKITLARARALIVKNITTKPVQAQQPITHDHSTDDATPITHDYSTDDATPITQLQVDPVVMKRTDAQNVHDHSVISFLRRKVQTFNKCSDDRRPYVMDWVLNNSDKFTESQVYDTMAVLDSLSEEPHSTLGVSEVSVLGSVVDKIGDRGEVMEILVRQLYSAIENGHIVYGSC
jgi:hypothetical protein